MRPIVSALLAALVFASLAAQPAAAQDEHLHCQYVTPNNTVATITLADDCSGSAWNSGAGTYYRTLRIVIAAQSHTSTGCGTSYYEATTPLLMRINGDFGSNYVGVPLINPPAQEAQVATITCSTFDTLDFVGSAEILIPMAVTSLFHKNIHSRTMFRNDDIGVGAGIAGDWIFNTWRSTASVSNVTFWLGNAGYFKQGSRFDVYAE
jgi:hypothetical protein